MFAALRVRTQLMILSGVKLALFALALLLAVLALQNSQTRFAEFIQRDTARLASFNEMYAQGLQSGQALRNIMLDPANRRAYDNLDKALVDFDAALKGDSELILIEGLFALYIDWIREAADLKVFVDLPSDARLSRRIVKHMKWGQTYEQVVNRYLDTVCFRHNELIEPTRWHADMIVNGTPNQGAAILEAYIETKLP